MQSDAATREHVLELVGELQHVPTDDGLDRDTLRTLLDSWHAYARDTQARPVDAKRTTYFRCGRGWGKNYTLANLALDDAEDHPHRALLASRTLDDTIETCVRGPSGIIAAARRRGYQVEFIASRGPAGTLVHPSGAELRLGSGDIPDGCRGPNLSRAYMDEIGSWRYGPEVVANVDFALRSPCPGGPLAVVVGTPSWSSKVRLDPDTTTVVEGSMDENADNLAPSVVAELRRRYAGSKLGAQELEGREVGVEGALLDLDVIASSRYHGTLDPDDITRIVVGVDPSVSAKIDRDAIGIVVVAMVRNGNEPPHCYVLEDATVPGCRVDVWARAVIDAYRRHHAGTIVVEVNQGGDGNVFALEQAARARGTSANVVAVHAKGSKRDRAERVLAPLYAQGRIHHVGDPAQLEALERELTEWTGRGKSPDRLDALVHAVANLIGEGEAPRLGSILDMWLPGDPDPDSTPLHARTRGRDLGTDSDGFY